MNLESTNFFLAIGTIGLQLLGLAFLALFFARKKLRDLDGIAQLLSNWGLWIGFLLTLASSALTLYYSDVLGILPCGWCWFQRAALYPQVFLFGLALWKRDKHIADYSILLSTFGLAVALYMHYLQMGGHGVLPCPASGAGDCGQRFVWEFGYITFPLMAASLFAFLIVLMLFVRRRVS